jgi:hypothetical protein
MVHLQRTSVSESIVPRREILSAVCRVEQSAGGRYVHNITVGGIDDDDVDRLVQKLDCVARISGWIA